MKPLTEYIKPALTALFFVVLIGGYYWWEHRPHHEKPEIAGQALVVVAKTVNACFSDMVRVTGFIVPKREAVVGADQEGSKVTDLFVREGDVVTENQELARLSAPPQQPGQQQQSRGPISLRAPAAGLITEVRTIVGAPASPQAGPMFRIAVNGEIELDAEVPSVHILKLNPGATARISRDGTSAIAEVEAQCPDVVFFDIAMPGMSGPDLQQELARRQQEIPIVFITAHRDETVRPRALAQGAVECLFKPFSETALLEALNAALRVNSQ